MNAQDKKIEKKSINRSIYGLLVMVLVVFLMLLTFIQVQNHRVERLQRIAYNYHLSISEKSQYVLGAIAEMNLWFKNVYIEKEEIMVHKSFHNLSDVSDYEMVSPLDKISSLEYEVKKYINEIRLLQDEYKDDTFSNISAQLFKSHIQIIESLKNIRLDDISVYKNIDDISSPLRVVAHQLSRLHKLEYQVKRRLMDKITKNNQKQLIIVIVVLVFIGIFGVIKLLNHLNSTFLQLIAVNKEKEFNQARFESMFESISDAVIVADQNRNVSLLNSSVKKMFGYKNEELMGNKTSMLYANIEDFNQTGKRKFNVDATDDAVSYEIEYRRKDGSIFWGETLGTKIISNDGAIFGYVGIIRDITERKKNEDELITHKEQLEELVSRRTFKLQETQNELVRAERLATLGQLTATVSHELRNPLASMRPSLYILGKKCDKNDESVQNAIQRLDRGVDRCDGIIDELLDYTRITALNLQPTQIDKWLEKVLDEQVLPEGIQLEKNFSLDGVELNIDVDRLRRVIINVFDNACHSMMDDNKKVITNKSTHLNVKTKSNDERVEIIITDTGSGISKDVLEKIFEPLFSTKSFGVGLGMPTVKQIMEQHKGSIDVYSEENKGTQVILCLPKVSNSKGDVA